MSGLGRLLKHALQFGFFVLLLLAVLTARVIQEGQTELAASDAAFNRGALLESVEHARRSATLYAPGAPHVEQAYERLIAIAVGSEATGSPKTAFLAWQAVRSAALESQHGLLPHAAELARANLNLARLEAVMRSTTDAERPQAQARALTRLNADNAPSSLWLAVLGAGFLLALSGIAWCAFYGLDAAGKVSWSRARLGCLLFAVGAACWTLAAYKA